MSEEYTNRELYLLVKQLSGKLDDFKESMLKNFQTTHEKQNETNGNVKKNTAWRLANEENITRLVSDRESKIKRLTDIIWKLAVIALGIVFGLDKLDKLF